MASSCGSYLILLTCLLQSAPLFSAPAPLSHPICDVCRCVPGYPVGQSYGAGTSSYRGTITYCPVGRTGFDFSNFCNLSSVPPEPWTLTFQPEISRRERTRSMKKLPLRPKNPLRIPSNAFPSLLADATAPPRFSLVIEDVELVSVGKGAFSGLALQTLSLVSVQMTSLHLDGFLDQNPAHEFPTLEQLAIVNCGLERVPIAELSRLTGLIGLNLNGNDIRMVNSSDIDALNRASSLQYLLMLENPFSCTCELLPFVKWLRGTSLDIMGYYDDYNYYYRHYYEYYGFRPLGYYCYSPKQLRHVSLLNLNLTRYLELNCNEGSALSPVNYTTKDPPRGIQLSAPFISGLVVLSIAVIAVAVMTQEKIKFKCVGLFRRYDRRRDVADEAGGNQHAYDAYVCHHGDMERFVAEEMIPRLEEEPNNFRLCLSFRDFLAGASDLDNVANAMATSRLVVVFLDGHFIASSRCMLELNMACCQMLEASGGTVRHPSADSLLLQGATRLLVVLLDALSHDSLPAILTALEDKITFLRWNAGNEERSWRQLVTLIQAWRPNQIQQMEIEEN